MPLEISITEARNVYFFFKSLYEGAGVFNTKVNWVLLSLKYCDINLNYQLILEDALA